MVRPKALDGVCFSNLPVLTARQADTDTPTSFLKSFSHELTSVCSLVVCSDYLPVVFFSDGGDTICHTARGLEQCHGGKVFHPQEGIDVQFVPLNSEELQDPSLITWLQSHFISLINKISTSSNYQNSIMNTIATNSIMCRGLTTCKLAQPLDQTTQMEIDRISSSDFAFFMTQNMIGIVVTYCCYILAGLSLSQAVLGLLLKLQQTICRRHPKKCSLCKALLCICHNLDSYLNPLSLTRGQVDRCIGQINMHIQEITARSARKDTS